MLRAVALSVVIVCTHVGVYLLGIQAGRAIEASSQLTDDIRNLQKDTTCIVEFYTSSKRKQEVHKIYGTTKEVM